MHVDRQGKVTDARFHNAVMRSQARLTYDYVHAMLQDETRARDEHRQLLPHLRNLQVVFRALFAARQARGALDMEGDETRIIYGADRKIERIEPLRRNEAHRIIEECMIAANVQAALFLGNHKLPTLYRIHKGPEADRLEELRGFLGELGLSLGGGASPEPRHYAKLLDAVRTRPDAHLVQTVLLRSLAQAVYAPENIGHFGLALECYGHFTSPIRRYPDLLVHRGIKHLLARGRRDTFSYGEADMQGFGLQCSMTERRADEATRDVVSWLKCEYMQDRIGEEFDGVITGVTPFGVFVELQSLYVEGLVHVSGLPNDYYHHDPRGHCLRGERTGRTLRLADKLRVRVVRVSLDDRKIDFEAVGLPAGRAGRDSRSRRPDQRKTHRRR
jgi:ribonuclease R